MQFAGQAAFVRAEALGDQGQLEEAIAGMRAILEALRAAGAVIPATSPMLLSNLAYAQWEAGEVEEGLENIAEAQAILTGTGYPFAELFVQRVKGELLLARSPSNQDEAEACFRTALDLARRQSGKLGELVAATSLARLWQRQGRREEARALLGEIYGWFTEGFDTRSLREAKALLDELDS
jgi:predicted ATPase